MTTILLCPNCAFLNPAGMRFCGNCGSRLPEDSPTERTPVQGEALGAMMGADLLERMRRAGLEAAGQRRNVTILFADLSGFTPLSERLDSEDLFNVIKRFIQALSNDVYKYEGIVDKFTGDGVMALFGAPIAHENNVERAVRASLDMQQDIASLNEAFQTQLGVELRVRIGLHNGSVIVGGMGTDMLMNYTAIGDTVNLAHRLEESAEPGTTLVSQAVYDQIHQLVDFEQRPGLALKGISRPVDGFRVMGLKADPGRVRGIEGLRSPLIGREDELRKLDLAAAALINRRKGQFILVTGEAGLGKSRLTAEFKASLDRNSIQILEGQSLSYRRSISYWIFLDVLYNYLGVSPNAPAQQIQKKLLEKVSHTLREQANEALPYLEYLLSLPYSDPVAGEHLQYLEAGQLRQQTFLAVRNLLLAETRLKPVLLILDDLHWVDEASLELLSYLLETIRQSPIFILALTRQVLAGSMAKVMASAAQILKERFITIPLQILSPDQCEQLLDQLLRIPDLPVQLREQIVQRAAGIPFYLEEILRMLIDQKAIQVENQRWKLVAGTDINQLSVPDTLQGLILARFDRLNGFQRRILQVASVIGKDFNPGVVLYILESPESKEIYNNLSVLTEREFVLPKTDQLDGEYTFRHILMSDAIFGTILRQERITLHGQVGQAIEAIYQDRIEEQIEILARHFGLSLYKHKALYYLIMAGEKSAKYYANTQARQYFEESLALLPQVNHTNEQILRIYMGLGDILALTGEYLEARSDYQTALEKINDESRVGFRNEYSVLLRKVSTTFERQGEYEQALANLANALNNLDPLSVSAQVEICRIMNDIGWIQFRQGNIDEAEKSLLESLTILGKSSQFDVIASIYNRLGGVYYEKDRLDLASNYLRKSMEMRQEIGDSVAVARSYNNLGLIGWKKGDWGQAQDCFKRSVELHANLGDVEGVIETNSNLGLLQLDCGEIDEAYADLQNALNTAEQIGHSYNIGMISLYLCRLFVSTEKWQEALEYGERSLEALKEIGAQDDLVNVYTYLGFANFGLGKMEEARHFAATARQMAVKPGGEAGPGADDSLGWILRLEGEIASQQGDLITAEKCLEASIQVFKSINHQIESGRSSMLLAEVMSRQGKTDEARQMIIETQSVFNQLGAKLDIRKLQRVAGGIDPDLK